jgi:hypothetical protein
MPKHVCNGALLKCSFGKAPGPLTVLPVKQSVIGGQPTASIMDNKPMMNIPCFGMCSSPANPAVAAIIAAGAGNAGPCVPVTPAPWLPGDMTVLVKKQPVLTDNSKLMCAYAGEISVSMPGQVTVGKG